jgi:uncharacterized membrane protein YraQ (UPF0718 family)/YHS domain-containing protein
MGAHGIVGAVSGLLSALGDGLANAARMAWEVGWALIAGFLLSGVVQAWVPRKRIEHALGGEGLQPMTLATALGAASSSCSYAAVAIAKSLFQKGASLQTAMAFQFASTNLVFELGIVMWIFLGWRFTLAELLGGLILIVLMWVLVRVLFNRREEEQARAHAQEAQTGHEHHSAGTDALPWRRRLTSVDAWSDVAHNFRGDWEMLWKEIGAGFLIAGFVALLPKGFFNALFLTHAWRPLRIVENVLVGPLVAALSFVCSIGNVPLAAVLWGGGISFGGVIAFIYADLIVVPIALIYRKYYGGRFAAKLVAAMFVAMALSALAIAGLFSLLGLVPTTRPAIADVTERPIGWNYTTWLDILFLVVAAGLLSLTLRRGAKDPMCGMTVDRHKTPWRSTVDGTTHFFCSAGCKSRFELEAERPYRLG